MWRNRRIRGDLGSFHKILRFARENRVTLVAALATIRDQQA